MLAVLATACATAEGRDPAATVAPDEARTIAREAFVYLYPMVQNYQTIYQFAIDSSGREYKGPFNTVANVARVFTSRDSTIVTANSDTPYSYLMMDLRAEPLVVTLPRIEPDRYYSLQLVDLYTHNVDYLGTRKDGNGGGTFLIAGPGWDGRTPDGITRVVRIPTSLAFGQFRTQLRAPEDLDRVKAIQAGYVVRPLSAFLGTPAPPAAPAVAWPAISQERLATDFWRYAAFLLPFAPPLAGEEAVRERFARIGLRPGGAWPAAGESPAVVQAVEEGGREAAAALDADVRKLTSSVGLFGTPELMRGKYHERALGAMGGIYGNDVEETFYVAYQVDADGQPLDAARHRYVLTFPKGGLPPVGAFWSVTMYDARTRLMVENPIERYLVNSPMLPGLVRDADGGITLHLQHESPGRAREKNWLPAPAGPMNLVMRLYLPKPEVIDGRWKAPVIRRVGDAAR